MQTDLDFNYLADKYIDMVYRIAFNCLKNHADSDDITQTVMIKLFRTTRNFQNEFHIKNWLIRVTINECKKAAMSVWRKRVTSIDHYANSLSFQTQEQSELYYAVMELSKKYRIVVYLYYYEDYSASEIARAIGISETAVQTRLMRARAKLKEELKGGWNND